MAIASAPLNLSAESTIETIIELRWSPPESDGGDAIAGYFIERSLNGAAFATLVSDTGNDDTFYTDSTLAARDNGKYRVSAINVSGTGPTSNAASATTSTSEAQTIKELLFNNWSLTGELSKIVNSNMTEVVNFIDRDQVPGNKKTKMVTVQKINAIGNENMTEHPRYFEQSELFEITCFLQVPDSADDQLSVWIDLMQQMTSEVSEILKTQYSPSSGTGEFFRTIINWTRDDTFFPDEPMLVRTLRFSLNRILSNEEEVFIGYPGAVGSGGVLVFDTSDSSGDSLPASDYIYTQTERVQIVQGWRNLPYLTTNGTDTVGVPIYFRGQFGGRFTCNMFLKKSDITPTTLNSLSQIFRPQSNGELGSVAFLHNVGNTEDPPTILTESLLVNITEIEKIAENEELVKFNLRGNLVEPSTFSTSQATTGTLMLFEDGTQMEYEDDLIQMEYDETSIVSFEDMLFENGISMEYEDDTDIMAYEVGEEDTVDMLFENGTQMEYEDDSIIMAYEALEEVTVEMTYEDDTDSMEYEDGDDIMDFE